MAIGRRTPLASLPYAEFGFESTITILTRVSVPRLWGLLTRVHALALPSLAALKAAREPVAEASIDSPATGRFTSLTFSTAALRRPEGQRLFAEYLEALRDLRQRLGPQGASRLEEAMDYRLALGIDTVDAGGRRVWLEAFHLDGVRGLRRTLEAIEGVGQGRELVLVDAEREDENEDEGGYVSLGDHWSVSREGVRLVYSDLDNDDEAISEEHRYEARLKYADFVDGFRAEVEALAGLLRPIAASIGRDVPERSTPATA